MTQQKATESQFNQLHSIVTEELINRLNKGEEASVAEIKAAIEWLAKNNITGVATSGSALERLLGQFELEEEDVQLAVR
jgi:hypothetical protein